MVLYLLRRVAYLVFVLVGVAVITFVIAYLVPADQAKMMAGEKASPEVVASIRREMGLDDPLWMQFTRYLGRAAKGDFGRSYHTRQLVGEAIVQSFPATLQLAIAAIFVELLLGIPLGILMALKQDKWPDQTSRALTLLGVSIPPFLLGALLLYFFAFKSRLFPLGGYGTPWHLILPAITLGVGGAAYYSRVLRSEMITILKQDYIRTARAKGLPERQVILKHALRNALIPIVTLVGMDLGSFMGGLVITESVFSWPGIATLAVTALANVDIPLIMGTVLFSAFCVALANLGVDLTYALIDPRIRYR
jgi:peptide/nickel transport system permease protein